VVRIGVVGGGQLARMMIPASINLGFDLAVFAEEEGSPADLAVSQVGNYREADELEAFARTVDVLTFDHEHVPINLLEALVEQGHKVFPPPQALELTHDKIVMRERLAGLGVPQPAWFTVHSRSDWDRAVESLGGSCVAKVPTGGYDGKGVRFVTEWDDISDWISQGPVLLEQRMNFTRELAQLGARSSTGEWATWPLVETRQVEGVCSEVLAPAELGAKESELAKGIALKIAESLGVVGVLAVELFHTDEGIFVNELAMRPHNSGHIFTELSATSQFEQHLRAIAGYPLGSPHFVAKCGVMVNVFSRFDHAAWVVGDGISSRVKVHDYQKAPREGRKAGHVVAVGESQSPLLASARETARKLGDARYDD